MTWEDLEQFYKIKFKLANGEFRPVNEWLDDIYLHFNPEKAYELIKEIMNNGEELFKEILSHKE